MTERLDPRIQLLDPVQFADQFLVPRLRLTPTAESISVHITCSSQKAGLADAFIRVANACSTQVVVPEGIHCCGFAGDKGFVMPELNESALAPLKPQVSGCAEGISTSRTCEIGLTRHSGLSYHSLFYLLDRVSDSEGP